MVGMVDWGSNVGRTNMGAALGARLGSADMTLISQAEAGKSSRKLFRWTYKVTLAFAGLSLLALNGALVWQEGLTRPMVAALGASIACLVLGFAMLRLIERKVAAEAQVLENQRRFDMAFAGARCGIWDWNLQENRVFWSSAMFDMLGRRPPSRRLSVAEIREMIHPDDMPALDDMLAAPKRAARSYDVTFRLQHVDGSWIWLNAKGQVWSDGRSMGDRLVGLTIDITEQKLAEARERQATERLRDAIESTGEAFVLVDAEDRLVICNSKFRELLKLDETAVAPGIKLDEVLDATGMPNSWIVNSDENGIREIRLDNGRWLQISQHQTKDGGQVSVGTDITAIKNQEAELTRNQAELRKTVMDLEQSRHKLQDQARQLVELAEKYAVEKTRAEGANRSKSEFLANIFGNDGGPAFRPARREKVRRICQRHQSQRPTPSRCDQRYSGYVENRGGPHDARAGKCRHERPCRGKPASRFGPRRHRRCEAAQQCGRAGARLGGQTRHQAGAA
jgi:two-component system cell cycle sensor histidine kinase PleC